MKKRGKKGDDEDEQNNDNEIGLWARVRRLVERLAISFNIPVLISALVKR